jgi:monovalent cation:H+ antiporter, CPA1 family
MMSSFDCAAILLVFAALIGVGNELTLRLPRPVALLLGSLLLVTLIIGTDITFGTAVHERLNLRISKAHLPQVLLGGLVALLLFAGGLQFDTHNLRHQVTRVFVLATVSVVLAAVLFGGTIWAALQLIGEPLPHEWCLVIGAILAPTDAVAVEGLLARAQLPPTLRATIAGESLFNDGAAVVLFTAALALVKGHMEMIGHGHLAEAILIEGGGGALLGAAAGYLAYRLISLTGDGSLAMTISLALAISAYRGAVALDISGPIAVVIAAMMLAHVIDRRAHATPVQSTLSTFWPFVAELLNTLLFLLAGFEVLAIRPSWNVLLAAAVAIPLALLARLLSVGVPMLIMRVRNPMRTSVFLTWAGLRGGISVALALIVPQTPYRDHVVTICFGVVIFSVVVQGLLLPRVAGALFGRSDTRSTLG